MASSSPSKQSDDGVSFECETTYRDHFQLRGVHWRCTESLHRGVILIVHGSGEHCRRYGHVARFFNERGFAVASFDMRGHGHSDGERGHVPSLNAIFDDIESMIQRVRVEYAAPLPLIIYAHGTGSLFCLGHIVRRRSRLFDCQAMILSSPSICLGRRPSQILFRLARVFAHLRPQMALPVRGNYLNVYTNDPDAVEAYRADPLVHDRWTAAILAVFLELGIMMEKNNIETPWPLLVQHGEEDGSAPISRVRRWNRRRVRGNNATFKEWPKHMHELHNDLEKEKVLLYAAEWICANLHI